MLSSVKAAGGAEWSVLIMDAVTTRVMSSACRISDILDYGAGNADYKMAAVMRTELRGCASACRQPSAMPATTPSAT